MNGIDAITDLTAVAGKLAAKGVKFAARYVVPKGVDSIKQSLTRSEARALADHGIKVVVIYEMNPTHASYFTVPQGTKDAHNGTEIAYECGMPAGRPVYYTVDMDVHPVSATDNYFKAVNEVNAKSYGYAVGAYGSAALVLHLKSNKLITFDWEAQSRGWDGFLSDHSKFNIFQGSVGTVLGKDVDFDDSTLDCGGWFPVS